MTEEAEPVVDKFYTVCFTGHRKLTPHQAEWAMTKLFLRLVELQEQYGDRLRAISGMAKGVDQIAAHLCTKQQIPWLAAIPHSAYPHVYNLDMTLWDELLESAAKVIYVVNDSVDWKPAYNFIRNQRMIEWSDLTLAATYWNVARDISKTKRPPGGTSAHIQMCMRMDKPFEVFQLDKE